MTPEEIAQAYRSGESINSIKARAHMAHRTLVRILTAQGIEIRPVGHNGRAVSVTPEVARRIIDAYERHGSLKQVCRDLHIGEPTVRKVLGDAGIELGQPRPDYSRPGPLDPVTLARLREAVGVVVA